MKAWEMATRSSGDGRRELVTESGRTFSWFEVREVKGPKTAGVLDPMEVEVEDGVVDIVIQTRF